MVGFDFVGAGSSHEARVTIYKCLGVEVASGSYAVREQTEQWDPNQTTVIVCDMWDVHHCLNAVRRAEEMARA
jgi:hypothetical protein